jgi:hypothetical protein
LVLTFASHDTLARTADIHVGAVLVVALGCEQVIAQQLADAAGAPASRRPSWRFKLKAGRSRPPNAASRSRGHGRGVPATFASGASLRRSSCP